MPGIGSVCSHGFHFRTPRKLKIWNPEILPRNRSARDWAEVARFTQAGDWDEGGEATRETENLVAWGGESCRDPARGEGAPGVGGGGARFSDFQVFRKRTLKIALGMTAKCPLETSAIDAL